jgi:hypothetical protein
MAERLKKLTNAIIIFFIKIPVWLNVVWNIKDQKATRHVNYAKTAESVLYGERR